MGSTLDGQYQHDGQYQRRAVPTMANTNNGQDQRRAMPKMVNTNDRNTNDGQHQRWAIPTRWAIPMMANIPTTGISTIVAASNTNDGQYHNDVGKTNDGQYQRRAWVSFNIHFTHQRWAVPTMGKTNAMGYTCDEQYHRWAIRKKGNTNNGQYQSSATPTR